MNINEVLFHQHWLLAVIFGILIILSFFSWYVIFKKFLFFKSEYSSLKNNKNSLSKSLMEEALKIINNQQENSDEITKKKLHLIFEEFKDILNFGQNFLASIANLTPFIGLFGTVIGVYLALMDISSEGNANIAVVAKPIGEALIATAIGLWCAIPASFAFNFFSKKSSLLLKKIKLEIDKKLIEIEEKK